MKRIFYLVFFLLCYQSAFSGPDNDLLISRLNTILDKEKTFDAEKLKRIEKLKTALNNPGNRSLNSQYNIYLDLYNEYKTFNYNQAFSYAHKLQQTGNLLNDPVKIAYAKIKLGFILLSSGMFKETYDSLRTVNVKL